MKIFQIEFEGDKQPNTYFLNPSIIKLNSPYLYLVTYRIIRYAVDTISIHPWKMWYDGYKFVRKHRSDLWSQNAHLMPNVKLYSPYKYRRDMGGDIVTMFDNTNPVIPDKNIEFDGTGMAIIKLSPDKNNYIAVQDVVSSLFDKEMNQDCRIQWDADVIKLTYNSFIIRNNSEMSVSMMTRDLFLDETTLTCYLTNETFCCENYENMYARRVEKNWSYISETNRKSNLFLYKLGKKIQFIDAATGSIFCTKCTPLEKIIDFFKGDLQFSLGTPTIIYKDGKIFAGHLKVEYKNPPRTARLKQFISDAQHEAGNNMRFHGKFIYLMFLCRMDESLNITHMSHAFIPTDSKRTSHLPYTLVFPAGIVANEQDNSVIISYGEGDVRSKLLHLNEADVATLLKPIDTLTSETFDFKILDKISTNIQVVGYYNKHNTGDDCFKLVMDAIAHEYCPGSKLTFHNPYDIEYLDGDRVIVGGGDVINPYFIDRIKKIMPPPDFNMKLSMISVGTPYTDCIHDNYLHMMNHVWTRNRNDVEFLVSKASTTSSVKYIPDIVHLLPSITPKKINHPRSPPKFVQSIRENYPNKLIIAFCLTRTIYHKDYEQQYFNMLRKLAALLVKLINENDVHVVMIPFGINQRNDKENDMKLHEHLSKLIRSVSEHVTFVKTNSDNFDQKDPWKYVLHIDNIFEYVNFAVLARFHAHVFCINHGIPFVSIATTRKVEQLLEQHDLIDKKFNMALSPLYSPIDFDVNALHQKIIHEIENRATTSSRIRFIFDTHIQPALRDFVQEFVSTIIHP